ncbi:MAG: glycosyl transferase [Rikenellaceae bacterium]|nr:glycosyl transferase [Rikenellaceae bacterium]
MKKIKKLVHYILHEPRSLALAILFRIAPIIPDRLYLKWLFRLTMGRKLNLDNPQTFSEKLQWLKLYNRKPEYTQMVDKYGAKQYVSERIGEEYIIPTLGVWDSFDEIEFEKLPNQFVLKTTHGGGNTGVVICKDKNTFDKSSARKCLNASLKSSIYTRLREWPYKNVKRRIIGEEYMADESGYELKDYKWFCFSGDPKALYIATDRCVEGEETKFDFFDADFNHLPFTNGHPNSPRPILKPQGFEKMKELAAKLSIGQPHLRVDFYDINGRIYFGELTFYHMSGIVPFEPEEWDHTLGSWIKLYEK